MHDATQRRPSNRPDTEVWAPIGYILESNALEVEQKLGMSIRR